MENERKFLIKTMPEDINSFIHFNLKQGYLSFNPEIRIRRKAISRTSTYAEYFFTTKGEGEEQRPEYEIPISKGVFNEFRLNVNGRLLSKVRYLVPVPKYIAELDIYEDGFEPTVEVEFKNMNDLNSFEIPDWFGEEVTHDPKYKNKNLFKKLNEGVI